MWRLGYEQGHHDALFGPGLPQLLEDIAEARQVKLAPPSRTPEDRVQDRIRLFEKCYAENNAQLGRPPGYEYNGGPV